MSFGTSSLTSKRLFSLALCAVFILESGGSPAWARSPQTGEIQRIQTGDRDGISYVQVIGKNISDYYPFLNRDPDGPPKLFITFHNTHLAHDVERSRPGTGSIAQIDADEVTNDQGFVTEIAIHFAAEETYQIKKLSAGSIFIEISKTNVPAPEPLMAINPIKPAPSNLIQNLRPGDALYISVSPADELSRDVTVDENGKISVPLLGAMDVTSYTAETLARYITRRLAQYVTNPKVDVLVKQTNAQQITLTGQVHSPGVYNYRPNMRLLDLISMAGGFTPAANKRQVHIYHGNGPTRRLTVLNAEETLKSGDVTKDFPLEPGDIVEVPKGDTAVTVFGEMNSTGKFDYEPNMRLLDLVAACNGFKDGANLKQIKVFRGEPPNVTVINTRFDTVLNGHTAGDFVLQPGDKVYVLRRPLWSYSALAGTLAPITALLLTGATLAIALKN